jgi:anti-sigma B factor antagonist
MSSFDSTPVGGHGTGAVMVTSGDGVAGLTLRGELDKAMAPSVRAGLAAVEGDIELDCAGLTFMDCAGISLFVDAYHACVSRGAKLTVVNAPRCVTRLSALTGVDRLVDVRPEDAAA